ncbi:ATP-binding cassette domain-containing protein [Streptomyces sp. NPDC060194]|uniref:ATP-binding cassette domain-containing protein n=1 Tax=Streptomyces sp. NPDC060194 TaxID=3347069 RepID=UPI00365BA363
MRQPEQAAPDTAPERSLPSSAGSAAGPPGERGAVRRLARHGRRFLRARRRAVGALALWSALEAAQTFLGGYAVARALDDGFLAGSPGTGLLWLAAAAAATLLGRLVVRGVFAALADLVEPLRDGLVRRTVRRALTAALADPARAGDTAAVSRLTGQTEIARDGFAGLVLTLRSFAATAVGALAGLGALAPELLPFVLLPLVTGLLLFLATLRPMAACQRRCLDADEALAAEAGRLAEGLRDLVACGAVDRAERGAGALITAQADAGTALARWAAVRTAALGVAAHLPVLSVLLGAPWLLRQGLTAGALVGALTYLTQAMLPAVSALLAALGSAGTRLVVVLDRLMGPDETGPDATRPDERGRDATGPDERGHGKARPFALPHAAPSPTPAASPAPTAAPPAYDVELRGVTFGYGPRPVVEACDFRLAEGEHLAVVGPSGVGKSTFAGLLAGLLAPRSGEVRLGGRPLTATDASAAARTRVLVPQEAYVFGGTLRENLTYLAPAASPEAVSGVVEAMGLHRLVDRLGGLDAELAPPALSPAERQLIAVGRACLSPAPLLILDEATCHLDPEAERRAELTLARRPGSLVVVAHRLGSARRAGRVLVMDGVRPVHGTHAELLATSPLYRDLAGVWEGDEGS